jgi:phage baseplate assembly protein gpV
MSLTGKIEPESSIKASISPTRSIQATHVSVVPTQKLTDLADIDITARQDGSLIVYDQATQTFKVRGDVENVNVSIIGGSF